jgi:hypothetical protein
MTMITIDDVVEYMPDVLDHGIQSYDDFFEKTRQDIFRRLRIEWWLSRRFNRHTTIIDSSLAGEMEDSKLDEPQFTRTAVFHCLAYYILPQLTKFNPEGDQFSTMIKFYKERYEEEWQLVLRDGVRYDDDEDGEYSTNEKLSVHILRLVR